ncbi:peptidase C12, ubiquitin carboxyl-terminal hydrolase [Cristinia sonorae]|uniref:Ubiquitin carboxyl-terminal hydrolase n=1 Tax=Cristinia sonorae TaxID=1940300 RepID=A0A8K0UIS1_9AGAR|nr:peptidase C12, ubiquitin carboxyl-terminal hydrolase [Cristinia sonorae]
MVTKNLNDTVAVPLEANPEVMNDWAEKAGLVISQDRFYDILGFDDELLDLVPKPVKAVILLFPVLDDVIPQQKEEDVRIAQEGQHPIDETVVWIEQTVHNWCGTMAILHALINGQ